MNYIILKSSNIYTADKPGLCSGGVVISGELIEGIITGTEIDAALSSGAEIIDCGERLIIPGFCDSHIHGYLGAVQMQSADLSDCTSEAECVSKMKEFYAYDASTDSDAWLLGFGWNHFSWKQKKLPDRSSLDAVFSKRPVCLFNEEMHSAWVNGAGLKAAGITRITPQPELGRIFFREDGEPNGYLLEPDAMKPVFEQSLKLKPEAEEKLIISLLEKAAELGITSISDIEISNTLRCGVYEKLLSEERLSCRIYPVFPMDTDIELLKDYRKRFDSDFLRFSGVKEFLDGTAPMYTGVLVEPYADKPGFNAPPLIDVETTKKRAVELDKNGFRIRFHACGAGAVRLGLDIFEEVRKQNGYNDTRHTIEHIENIHPDDIPRFKKLSVTASVQPDHLWAETFAGHPFHKLLGEERCRLAWPFKTLLDSGADLAFGTDFPVSPLNPMQGLYRAISRLHEDGQPDGGWNPQEKLSLEESISLYTDASSKQMYAEKLTGKLKAGMAADIAVVDGNLFDMSPDEIRAAKIYLTMSAGRIVKQI